MSLLLPPDYQLCTAHGCRKRATRIPVLCIPKVGKPRERQHCIESVFDIPCCPDHLPGVRELFNEAIRVMAIQKAAKSPDKPLLDFNNVWVEANSMYTPKYREMKARQRKGQQI